ncbi:VOC family protein [Alkalicoccobacillus plakortidis]|uniref:VOC family protein n=1 Tax=Alkalicoccobacillus plakortidis TaxID=444060 RepID=A0ABT0XNF6_9BACI|nr:VOC family protein [Alkalicoccobacillus plakortidis]MCM2677426.1 VOC family protein [Alkalicoccobacillus plakortidis]
MLKLGAIFIPVTDVKKSVEWYKDVLELNHVGNWQGDEGADFYFNSEKQYVTLVKLNENQPTKFLTNSEYQNTYYNFTTDNIEELHRRLSQKGAKVTEIYDDGAIYAFEFYDLDENKLGVVVDK